MVNHINEMNFVPAMPERPSERPIYIIGAGEIIVDAQAPAYNLAGFKMAGIYNRTVSTAEKVAAQFGIEKVFDDLDEIISEGSANHGVFDLALPANLFLMVLRKLPENSAILIQKPMGESIEEATEILNICRAKKITAGINFQLRQAPYMLQLKDMIDNGVIGEVYDLDWKLTTLQPWHLWSFLESKERAEINYHSIHYIDAIRYLLGEPEAVWCKTVKSPKNPNMAQSATTIILNYGDSIRASIITNHAHDFATDYQESYLKIEGTKGAIKITIGLLLDYPKGKADKFEYITEGMDSWVEVPIIGSWFPESFIGTMGGLLKKLEDPSYNYLNSVEDAYKTMQVVEACYKSDASGGTKV